MRVKKNVKPFKIYSERKTGSF